MSAASRGELPERRVHGAEPRLRSIIEHLPDGILIVCAEGVVRFANPAAEELFGRSLPELVGESLGFPVTGGTTEIDVVKPGGATVTAELRVVETEWEGEPALLVALRDITDRKQAEERAQQLVRAEAGREQAEEAERRTRLISDASALLNESLDYRAALREIARLLVSQLGDWCLIDVVDAPVTLRVQACAHRSDSCERALREIRLHYPPAPEAEDPASSAIRTSQPVLLRKLDDAGRAAIARDDEHARLLRELGTTALMSVPLNAHGHTLGAITLGAATREYGRPELELAQEIAQRTALAMANAGLYEEAQQANRSKADFLAVMSHELRTPLNAINGYTDLLDLEVAGPINEKQKDHLRRIKTAASHLLHLVEEILSFSRLEAGDQSLSVETADLNEVVREAASLLEPLVDRKRLRLTLVVPHERDEIRTDVAKVRQILMNLISNAIKFTEKGGIELATRSSGDRHHVTVRDTGNGIAAEHLERIFEPFWQVEQTVRRKVGGTGLGLSVARRLARLLGGELSVESTPGKGSTFTVSLPDGPPATTGEDSESGGTHETTHSESGSTGRR